MQFFGKHFFLLFSVLLFLTPNLFSQEMKDQLYMVREEVVRVDMWDQYESTSIQWVELMTQGGLDFPYVRASQRDDGHYYYLIPINSYADIDKFPGIFGSAIEKAGKDKWANFMVENDTSFNVQIGNVSFEPGARTNWHFHPGGQILLVTNGKGLYQEKGKPVRTIQQGDIVKCLPNVIHWHGAEPGDSLVHISISTNTDKGPVVWLEPVSDKDYFLKH
jgi:quercetin dioxygenase-like cupin family protein